MLRHLLGHRLVETAARTPDAIAIHDGAARITYAELAARSHRLARRLIALGAGPGSRVGLQCGRSIDSFAAIFAILEIGAAYVPIEPSWPAARTREVLESVGAEVVVCTAHAGKKLVESAHRPSCLRALLVTDGPVEAPALVVSTFADALAKEPATLDPATITDGYPAYILFTSGSTGRPKGVVLSHANATTFVDTCVDFFGTRADDRFASHAALSFDLSVFDIFVAVSCGASIVIVPDYLSAFPEQLAKLIADTRITVWNSVATALSLLAVNGGVDRLAFPDLRLVFFSGAVLPAKHLRVLKQRWSLATFFNIYGQTEANSSMYHRVGDVPDDDSWRAPLGQALPNFETFVLDDAGREVTASDVEGELHVRSRSVGLGYWNDPERTQAAFVRDPIRAWSPHAVYRTGDVVRRTAAGDLVFVGRRDSLVKSRGYRVDLGEIEACLLACPGVEQAIAIAIPDELVGNRIVAFVEVPASFGTPPADKALRAACATKLPPYMVPETISTREVFPLNSHGKIDRKALLAGA